MVKKLDINLAAYLGALKAQDPESAFWTASWRLIDGAKERGAEALALTTAGAFSTLKEAYRRKLVDKATGRASEMDNGYSINAAGREALSAWRSEQGLDEREEVED